MRNHYFVLFLCACLLIAPLARAQQPWQPFRPGLTYQLSESAAAGDTTHALRLAAGAPIAGTPDSLFRFTKRVGPIPLVGFITCFERLRLDNLFGATLRSQPRAVFTLAAANGRALTLRPRAPLGQSWATGLAGLTASVTSRGLTSRVLGGGPDSVVTITFSDGQALYLTKTYGLLQGPSLDSYLNGRNRRRQLVLTALPERQLGTPALGAHAVHNYQPGDVFQRIIKDYSARVLCTQTWQQDSVLTRQPSRTGDTITYTIRTRRRIQTTGTCSPYSRNTSYSTATTTLQAIKETPALPDLTANVPPAQVLTLNGYLASAATRNSAQLGNRLEHSVVRRGICGSSSIDSVGIMQPGADNYVLDKYATGLGLTYENFVGLLQSSTTELTAYRKGTEFWGTFFTPAVLLAAREVRPDATTTALPNPFGETLTASFVLASAQPVGATLYDALGRQVRAVPAASLGTGSRQLVLPTAGLPAGIYMLHLHFAAEGRREVLQVVKAE
ncbi:MAG: hypothetical protein ACRYFZ_12500 [Janthinobacterium lividum]